MEAKKIEIKCLDKPRNLVMNLNALAEAGEVTGRNYFAIDKSDRYTPSDIRALLWAGLKHEDPNLKLEDVGRLVASENMLPTIETLVKAMVGEVEVGEDSASPLASKGGKHKKHGPNSGPMAATI